MIRNDIMCVLSQFGEIYKKTPWQAYIETATPVNISYHVLNPNLWIGHIVTCLISHMLNDIYNIKINRFYTLTSTTVM